MGAARIDRRARADAESIPTPPRLMVTHPGQSAMPCSPLVFEHIRPARAPERHERTRTTWRSGYGAHHCPGAPLARLEAQVALPMLFERFPHMKLAVAADELGTAPGFIANGYDRMPVLLK
ncbi:hypothetical protein GCM10027089_42080 [Nocardia thraciensis]